MPLDNQGNLAGVTGANGRLYYRQGANWYEVQGVSSMAIAPDQAQAQTQTGFEGSVTFPGAPTIGQATFETASVVPLHRSWKFLEAARAGSQQVLLNFETQRRSILDRSGGDDTAAIATTGAVTFAETTIASLQTAGVARGMVLDMNAANGVDNDDFYIIEQISPDGMVVSKAITSDGGGAIASPVTAANFAIIIPILQWAIAGTVISVPKGDIGTESPITGQLIIQPRQSVPLPTPVGEHRGA